PRSIGHGSTNVPTPRSRSSWSWSIARAIASARSNRGARASICQPGKPINTCSWISVRPSSPTETRPVTVWTLRTPEVMRECDLASRPWPHKAGSRRERDVRGDGDRQASQVFAPRDLDHAEAPEVIGRQLHVQQLEPARREPVDELRQRDLRSVAH